MQEEVNEKVIALSIKSTKLTAETLKQAIILFLKMANKGVNKAINSQYKGKQNLKNLVKQNTALSNIEITDKNIKSFERTAQKYGVDFSVKKDGATLPPTYLVFFKGRDIDVINHAFKEFTQKELNKVNKPSIKQRMEKAKSIVKDKKLNKVREKTRGGMER